MDAAGKQPSAAPGTGTFPNDARLSDALLSDDRPGARATAFLAAFNKIESELRQRLHAEQSDSFSFILRHARRKGIISKLWADRLDEYRELRNAISHGEYDELTPIADPLPATVREITFLSDLITSPPIAHEVLIHQEVSRVAPDTSLSEVLNLLLTKGYSQFPVWDGHEIVALLTTNTIARWVAADLADDQALDARTVSDALAYVEKIDEFVVAPRKATVIDVVDLLSPSATRAIAPRAVIITENGTVDNKPLRVITSSDLPLLLPHIMVD